MPSIGETVRKKLIPAWTNDDEWRLWKHTKYTMTTPNEREYRYEERDDMYNLKRWQYGEETTWRGELYSRPEWLKQIIDTATVGGHLKRVNQPPPNAIVWFTTDLDNNLLTFLELT